MLGFLRHQALKMEARGTFGTSVSFYQITNSIKVIFIGEVV
jgi:hypothetical protein